MGYEVVSRAKGAADVRNWESAVGVKLMVQGNDGGRTSGEAEIVTRVGE